MHWGFLALIFVVSIAVGAGTTALKRRRTERDRRMN